MSLYQVLKDQNPHVTPQSEPMAGTVQNSAQGYSFPVDHWTKLDRFLILGTEGGSYYANERKLTKVNLEAVQQCLAEDGQRVIKRIVEISQAGRAPKNDPALYVLAMALSANDLSTKQMAGSALPLIARTGTHLLHLAAFVHDLRGWGRTVRRSVARWYLDRTPLHLAQQLTKYANRDGWTHRDVLRLAHVKPVHPDHHIVLQFAVKGALSPEVPSSEAQAYLDAVINVKQTTSPKEVARLIQHYKLPREVIPSEMLNHPEVWEALLPHMGLTALVRNLATMTRIGLIGPLRGHEVIEKLLNETEIKASRIHPIQVLAALMTYANGQGVRGQHRWQPVSAVVAALDTMFGLSFQNVIPTGKRIVLALDISGSMDGGMVAGVPGLTPRVASAAMAMMTARTESQYCFVGFTSMAGGRTMTPKRSVYDSSTGISELAIHAKQDLKQVTRYTQGLVMGGTDCALPMLWAQGHKVEADAFIIYTDSETWAGAIHPMQALRQYRQATGLPAKLIVVGMVSNGFSIADPNDAGSLDVVGFDTAAPAVIADFIRGDIQ